MMTLQKGFLYLIGVIQIALGFVYLLAPQWFIAWQGLSPIGADIGYPLSMLAGRFLVYGAGMFVIATDPVRHRFWLLGMVAIQAIDLVGGLFYTLTGVVALEHSAFPMFNATWIMIGLYLLRNSETTPEAKSAA